MWMTCLALMICTLLPVIARHTGIEESVLAWLAFGFIIVKSVLLVDHFMEMKAAPIVWRLAAQAWAPLIVAVVAAVHGLS